MSLTDGPRGAELRRRVTEAAAWCDPRADPRDPARSLRQLPDPALGVRHPADQWERVVAELAESRRSALGHLSGVATPGRLLAYLPDEQLADGAAEEATGGFFDVDNTPPWDTWVAWVRLAGDRTLIAYVPPVFFDFVDRALRVQVEDCFHWLDEAAGSG